jgi:hypothetical protein
MLEEEVERARAHETYTEVVDRQVWDEFQCAADRWSGGKSRYDWVDDGDR